MSWTIERRGHVPGASRWRPAPACSARFSPRRRHTRWAWCTSWRRAGQLLDRAIAVAGQTPGDCLGPYAFTKRACQAAALRDIAELAGPLDGELPGGMTTFIRPGREIPFPEDFPG